MNLVELCQRVKSDGGRSGLPITAVDDLSRDDQRIVDWVRDRWRNLQAETSWRWMRRTVTADIVDGQASYTPAELNALDLRVYAPQTESYYVVARPDGLASPLSRLEYVPYEVMRRLMETTTGGTGPQYWSIGPQDQMLLLPTPVGNWDLTFDYYTVPTELLLATDSPNFPSYHHMILVWGALIDLAGFDNAAEVHARAQANYIAMRDVLVDEQGPDMVIRRARF